MSTTRHRGLAEIGRAREALDQLERAFVVEARNAGDSWQDIGDTLGVTRQAAHRRYAEIDPLRDYLQAERAARAAMFP